jgi:hypothetical protein
VGDDLEKRYTPFDRILHGLALGHLGLQKIPHRPPPTRGGQPSSSFPDRLKSPTISTRRAAEIGLASSACRNSRLARAVAYLVIATITVVGFFEASGDLRWPSTRRQRRHSAG